MLNISGRLAPMTPEFDTIADVIRSRRTHMLVDRERDVPLDLVEQLCSLAMCAPNHKTTWPWRFAAFVGEGRARLGQEFVTDMTEVDFGDEGKRAKTLTKYTRTPAVLVVGSASHPQPQLEAENRYAVAAGIQNLLLGATAVGLTTFWSTPPLPDSKRVIELCGFEPDVTLIGVVYLGWPRTTVRTPERPPVSINIIDG